MLEQEFPDIPLIGEEDPSVLAKNPDMRQKVLGLVQAQVDVSEKDMLNAIGRGSGTDTAPYFWTLDPIDGTKGFLRQDQYAVALALIKDGELQLGVLGCPNLSLDFDHPEQGNGALLYAVKGEGAFLQPLKDGEAVRIKVDTDPGNARFVESVESAHSAHSVHTKISDALNIGGDPLRIDSQCKYAVVARGDVAIYLRYPRDDQYREKIWDHAAGAIIVQEAGGTVSDIFGTPLNFGLGQTLKDNKGIVVTNGIFHNQTIETIERIQKGDL
ncbi:MAG: inositol monophosphatase family protein [candidate division KSB1 bacterium]|nr:inositol monophosphatase family protein [candidate division KSB1 bacterium]